MADGLRKKLMRDGAQIAHSSYVGPCALHTVSQTVRYDRPYGFTTSLETLKPIPHVRKNLVCAASHTITFWKASRSLFHIPDDFWVMWEGPPIAHTHLATVPKAVAERG